MKKQSVWYVPITPGGTPVAYGAGCRMGKVNAARTEKKAWENLMKDAAHMPYRNKQEFIERGYTIEVWSGGWEP
jgi:hypothetical protein